MSNDFEKAATDGVEGISSMAFAELMLLSVIDALGSVAICLLFWPRLLFVFTLEAVFAIATVVVARQIVWNMTNQIDSITEGIRSFSDDHSFRFEAKEGSLEDALNMWMDSVAEAREIDSDLEAIDDDARRIELIADGMLSGIVPRDADMILEVRASAEHIQGVVASRSE